MAGKSLAKRAEKMKLMSDLAAIYWKRAEFKSAIKVWKTLSEWPEVQSMPELHASTLQTRAMNHSNRGEHEEAIELAERALKLAPESPENFYAAGGAYDFAGQTDQAMEYWRHALTLNPTMSCVIESMAISMSRIQKYDDSEDLFRQAIEMKEGIISLNGMASLLIYLHRYDESLEYLRRCKEIAPDSPFAHTNSGNCYLHMEQLEDAEAEFREATDILPEEALTPVLGLAVIHHHRGDLEAAEELFQQALKLHGTRLSWSMTRWHEHDARRAMALVGLGDPEAIEVWETVLQNPDVRLLGEGPVLDWVRWMRYPGGMPPTSPGCRGSGAPRESLPQ